MNKIPCRALNLNAKGRERKEQVDLLRDLFQDYGKSPKKSHIWFVLWYNKKFADE